MNYNPRFHLFTHLIFLLSSLKFGTCCFGIGPSLDEPGSGTLSPISPKSQKQEDEVKPDRRIKKQTPSNDKIVLGLLGDWVSWTKYPLVSASKTVEESNLNCSFERRPCCWNNDVYPADQLEWILSAGRPNQKIFYRNFGPFEGSLDTLPPFPNGYYLVVGSEDASESDEAHFKSCPISCANGPITVTARHWSTPLALLQVCMKDIIPEGADDESPLYDCQELPVNSSPGPTRVMFLPARNVQIVLVASNLISAEGEMVIVDEITVDYNECNNDNRNSEEDLGQWFASSSELQHTSSSESEEVDYEFANYGDEDQQTSSPIAQNEYDTHNSAPITQNDEYKQHESHIPPVPVAIIEVIPEVDPACTKVNCRFENGSRCSYVNSIVADSPLQFHRAFDNVKGNFHNRVTGAPKTNDGLGYLASYLYPGEHSAIETDVYLGKETKIRFMHYEATSGVQMKACCNSHDQCPFITSRDVNAQDREWKQSSFTCPPATEKIIFVCENTYFNQGACALDYIQLITNDGQSCHT